MSDGHISPPARGELRFAFHFQATPTASGHELVATISGPDDHAVIANPELAAAAAEVIRAGVAALNRAARLRR